MNSGAYPRKQGREARTRHSEYLPEVMGEHKHAGQWGLIMVVVIVVASAYALEGATVLGPIAPALTSKGYAALIGAVLAIGLKLCFSVMMVKEFKPHERGQDVCLMTLGTAIPGAVAVLANDNATKEDLRVWFTYALVAFVALFASAFLTKGAEQSKPAEGQPRSWRYIGWSVGTMAFGVGVFVVYILIVVTKAQSK